MSKLTVRIETWEKALAMQIQEQDFEYKQGDEFVASNGLKVRSFCHSALHIERVYIRGSNPQEDFKLASLDFATNKERDEYHKQLLIALEEFSDNNFFAGKVKKATVADVELKTGTLVYECK
jgi:hypothetical protein